MDGAKKNADIVYLINERINATRDDLKVQIQMVDQKIDRILNNCSMEQHRLTVLETNIADAEKATDAKIAKTNMRIAIVSALVGIATFIAGIFVTIWSGGRA